MEDGASIPLACMTALQALRGYEGDLEGKTVFIPAGRMYRHVPIIHQLLTWV